MIILNESNTSQTIYFIPRYYTADSLVLTDQQTGEVYTYAITPTQVDHYFEVTETFDTIEGRTYRLKVLDGTEVVYKDIVFCTNQTISSFSVNNGEYVQNTSNNDFIILS